MAYKRVPEHGITHSTIFHADDVFSTALLQLINPFFTYERTLKVPEVVPEGTIVYDIGLGEFDHHQKDNEVRANGVPYAAFGKLWREFGGNITVIDGEKRRRLTETEVKIFDEIFVQKIDKTDNLGTPNELSSAISAFNTPQQMSKQDPDLSDNRFAKAVGFAKELLEVEIEKIPEISRQRNIVIDAFVENHTLSSGVLVLPEYVNVFSKTINELLQENDIDFIVYPSNRGGYNMQQVPQNPSETKGRISYPEKWCGAPMEKLPEHVTFCHTSNWLLAIDAKNPIDAKMIAEKLAEISRDENDRENFEKMNEEIDL